MIVSNLIDQYIVIVDNVVPHDLCDAIIKEYENDNSWDYPGTKSGIAKNTRNVNAISISHSETISHNPDIRSELDACLFKSAGFAIASYVEKFPAANIEEDQGYDLLRYKEGQFYKQHTDSCKQMPRSVSCSFALNDNYQGGEWGFFDRQKVLKVKKGSAIMFPSDFMYPHEIMPVTKGVRYSIVTWFV